MTTAAPPIARAPRGRDETLPVHDRRDPDADDDPERPCKLRKGSRRDRAGEDRPGREKTILV